jgi:hypothetical protein
MRLNIRVTNPSSSCRGVSQLLVDGKAVEGNLLPLSAMRDGAQVEVVLAS